MSDGYRNGIEWTGDGLVWSSARLCHADSETFHFGAPISGRRKWTRRVGYGNEEGTAKVGGIKTLSPAPRPFNELKLNVCMMEISSCSSSSLRLIGVPGRRMDEEEDGAGESSFVLQRG